jgi:UDP-2,4-diacetamido-2,4,6-trideoxy-beta-L-altropyranose hydrolase
VFGLVIRADGSAGIGSGHLRRCLALAKALRQCGAEVTLVTRALDAVAQEVLAQAGLPVLWLPGPPVGDDEDARQTWDLSAASRPAVVLVDHYGLGAAWHASIRRASGARVVAIDDLADRPMAVDLLVDHNLRADAAADYGRVLRSPAKILSGPGYALLDPAYADAPRHVPGDTVESIGIFMGGTDPAGAAVAALVACRERVGFAGTVEVVSSPVGPHHEELVRIAARWPGTAVLTGLPGLADFFRRHGLQLGAGGGAVWERCCIGPPTIACDIAPNQLSTLPAAEAAGALVWVRGGPGLADGLAQALRALLQDPARRHRLSAAAARLVDGQGSARVAAVIAALAGEELRIRPAGPGDEDLLLRWANDPAVRAQAFHPAPITPEQHHRWFAARLAAGSDCRLWIAEAANGLPAGQVRLERDGEAWEISYSLAADFRGMKLAHRLLAATLPDDAGAKHLVARVKPGNMASVKVFERLGFEGETVTDARGRHWLFRR